MKILLSNDDGFDAEGIIAIEKEISRIGKVITIAPHVEQSAKGHSFTMSEPLRLTEISQHRYHLSGTPADCVYIGLCHVCPEVDVVVSGINRGANLAHDVYYSGTVAAAREAAIQGKKGIAVSLLTQKGKNDYSLAAKYAVKCIEALLQHSWEAGVYWNINIPSAHLEQEQMDVVIKPLGHRRYRSTVQERDDPRGRKYYWIGGPAIPPEVSDTDVYWCAQGKIVLTPLHLNCTHSRWEYSDIGIKKIHRNEIV